MSVQTLIGNGHQPALQYVATVYGFDDKNATPGELADVLQKARDTLTDKAIVDLDPPTTVGDLQNALYFLNNGHLADSYIKALRGSEGERVMKALLGL